MQMARVEHGGDAGASPCMHLQALTISMAGRPVIVRSDASWIAGGLEQLGQYEEVRVHALDGVVVVLEKVGKQ